MAIALSSAMLFATAACGTSDKADAGTDSAKGSDAATITSYDVSSVEKDDTIAALLPESVTKDASSPSAPTLLRPGRIPRRRRKTQIGYDMDLARAMGNIFGLETEIVSSNFDTIIPPSAPSTIWHRRLHHHQGAHGIRRLRLLLHRRHGLCSGHSNPRTSTRNDLCGLKRCRRDRHRRGRGHQQDRQAVQGGRQERHHHPVLQAADRRHHRCGDRQGRRLLRRFPGCRLRHRPDRWSAGTARQGLR